MGELDRREFGHASPARAGTWHPGTKARSTTVDAAMPARIGPPDRIRRQDGGRGGQDREGAVAEQQEAVAGGGEALGGRVEPAVDAVAVRRRLDLEAAAGAKPDDDQILLADPQQGPDAEGRRAQKRRQGDAARAQQQLDHRARRAIAEDPLQLPPRQAEPGAAALRRGAACPGSTIGGWRCSPVRAPSARCGTCRSARARISFDQAHVRLEAAQHRPQCRPDRVRHVRREYPSPGSTSTSTRSIARWTIW